MRRPDSTAFIGVENTRRRSECREWNKMKGIPGGKCFGYIAPIHGLSTENRFRRARTKSKHIPIACNFIPFLSTLTNLSVFEKFSFFFLRYNISILTNALLYLKNKKKFDSIKNKCTLFVSIFFFITQSNLLF